jgi:hypothetical protein
MVAFIRGYIEQQSGAALGPVSDEVQLALDAVRPVAPCGLIEPLPSSNWKEPPVTLARRY